MTPVRFTQVTDPRCIGNILSFLDPLNRRTIVQTMEDTDKTLGKLWVVGNIYAKLNISDPHLEDPRLYQLILKAATTFKRIVFDRVSILNLTEQTFELAELENLIKICPNIERLSIKDCKCLTNEMVILLSRSYPRLKSLDLAGCSWISTQVITLIATYCRELEELTLANCSETSDTSVELIARNCGQLKKIDLFFCSKITNRSLLALAQCGMLEELTLSFCDELDENGILEFVSTSKSIQNIDITNCNKIQGKCHHEIRAIRPNIQVIA